MTPPGTLRWDGGGLPPVGTFLSLAFDAMMKAAAALVPIVLVASLPIIVLGIVAEGRLGVNDYLEEFSTLDTDPVTGEPIFPEWDADADEVVLYVGALGVASLIAFLVITPAGIAAVDLAHRGARPSVADHTVFGALRRSWRLTDGKAWPVAGRMLLLGLIMSLASNIVSAPLQLVGVPAGAGIAIALSVIVTMGSQALAYTGSVVVHRSLEPDTDTGVAPAVSPWGQPSR